MRICVKDLTGSASEHDPLSVSYVVIGGWYNILYVGIIYYMEVGITSFLQHAKEYRFVYQNKSSYALSDLNPYLNVYCPSFGVCKTFSAHEARCVCYENCPSYQDPVCTSNGTTYDNKCLYELSYCKGLDNNTVYHPGSCEGK